MTPPELTKREAILDAALELFVQKGFHGTAVPELAQRAGVGAGTIYRHFENKEAVVNALYRHWKSVLSAQVLESFPYDKPARAQFRFCFERYMAFGRQHPSAHAFLDLHHHADYLDADSRALESRLEQVMRGVIAAMQAEGAVKAGQVEVILAVILGIFVGVLRGAWTNHLTLDDATLDLAERCCWEAIRA